MFAGSPIALAAGCVFTSLLVAACISDLRTRRIPNALVGLLAAAGLVFALWSGPGWPGVVRALGGFGVGLIIWLPFWLLRMLGAGDVKLFAAAGAWLGPWSAFEAALLAAVVGGVLALGWLVWKRGAAGSARTVALWVGSMRATRSVHPVIDPRDTLKLPYGVALSAGAVIVGWVPGILLRG